MTPGTDRASVVVITGASSGFGKGTARRPAEHGASLVLAARRGELLERLARDCEAAGGRAAAVQTGVSRTDEVERLGRTAIERFGRIDVWINNAGVGPIGPFDSKIVGADGVVKILAKKLMPGVADTLAAKQMERTQMQQAPPGADSPGAVRAPVAVGTEVSAGRRRGR